MGLFDFLKRLFTKNQKERSAAKIDTPTTTTTPTNDVDSTTKPTQSQQASYTLLDDTEVLKKRAEAVARKKEEFAQELSAIPRAEITLSETTLRKQALSDMPKIHCTNITRATKIDKLFPLVVIKLATTGLQFRGTEIVELSAIKFDVGFKPVSCFTTLVKPRRPIPEEATKVNGVTNDMVSNSPSLSSVSSAFLEYISDCTIIGHNIIFDLKFLHISGFSIPENVRYYDTYDLVKRTLEVDGEVLCNYKLITLCDYYCIHRPSEPSSLSDCLAIAKVFHRLIKDKTM